MKVQIKTLHSEVGALDDLGDVQLPASISEFARIWLNLRGNDVAPLKSVLDPLSLPPRLLPNIMLWDVMDGDYRVRLAGTAYRNRAQQELSGLRLSDVYGNNVEMQAEFEAVARRQQFSFIEQHVRWFGAAPALRTRLLLPLSVFNGVAEHLVGFIGPPHRFELTLGGDVRRLESIPA